MAAWAERHELWDSLDAELSDTIEAEHRRWTSTPRLDFESRQLLRRAVSNRRRELVPHNSERIGPKEKRPKPEPTATNEPLTAIAPESRGEARPAGGLVDQAATRFKLSEREAQVLALVCEGLTNVEIGERLFLGTQTVATHVKRILAKMRARNRTHAVVLAFRTAVESPVLGMDRERASA